MSQWLRASLVTKLACITLTVRASVANGSKSKVKSWPVTHPTTTTKGLIMKQSDSGQTQYHDTA